jgi:guanylate kinase
MIFNHQPFLIIISSPSGAGKSTLCKMIIENNDDIKLSISCTTRKKRDKEIDGKDYFFINKEKFDEMIKQNQFIEHAEVFSNFYATPKENVDSQLAKGNCVLFDIDWQGARQIKEKFDKNHILSIFILPPSLEELHKRLQSRAQDDEKTVSQRMKKAVNEISHYHEYDFVLINDDLEKTFAKINSLIMAKKLAMIDKNQLANFVSNELSKF